MMRRFIVDCPRISTRTISVPSRPYVDVATLGVCVTMFGALAHQLNARFDRQDARFALRFDQQDARFDHQQAQFAQQQAQFAQRFDQQDARFDRQDARFDKAMAMMNARFDKQDGMLGGLVEAHMRSQLPALLTMDGTASGAPLFAKPYPTLEHLCVQEAHLQRFILPLVGSGVPDKTMASLSRHATAMLNRRMVTHKMECVSFFSGHEVDGFAAPTLLHTTEGLQMRYISAEFKAGVRHREKLHKSIRQCLKLPLVLSDVATRPSSAKGQEAPRKVLESVTTSGALCVIAAPKDQLDSPLCKPFRLLCLHCASDSSHQHVGSKSSVSSVLQSVLPASVADVHVATAEAHPVAGSGTEHSPLLQEWLEKNGGSSNVLPHQLELLKCQVKSATGSFTTVGEYLLQHKGDKEMAAACQDVYTAALLRVAESRNVGHLMIQECRW